MRYPILPRKEQTVDTKIDHYVPTTNELYLELERRITNTLGLLYELETEVKKDFDTTQLAEARIDMRVCMNFLETLKLRQK